MITKEQTIKTVITVSEKRMKKILAQLDGQKVKQEYYENRGKGFRK